MKKFGLVLGSGGGRGIFHIGVLQCLEDHGVKPDIVTGSSIGSMVGGLWASSQDMEEFDKKLANDKMMAAKAFFDPSFRGVGLVKGESMKKVLLEMLGTDEFQDLNCEFAAVSCDLKKGDRIVLKEGSLSDAVRASMAIPGTFQPVEIDGMMLADGGIIDPVPDSVAKDMGAEVVLSVNLDHRVNEVLGKKDLNRIDKVLYRMLNIMRHSLAAYSLNDSDIVLNPPIEDDGMVSLDLIFKEDKKKALIEMGYQMMEERIEELKKLLTS